MSCYVKIAKIDKDGNIVKIYDNKNILMNEENISWNQLKYCMYADTSVNGYRYKNIGKVYAINNCNDNKSIVCPYCGCSFKNYNGLCKHIFKFKSHGNEISKEKLLADTFYNGEIPKCKCGCGEYTNISYEGGAHFADYKVGHIARINNNWGNNANALKKSAETRRKKFKDGAIIQWNKGKKWIETYSEVQIKELTNKISNKLHDRVKNSKFKISSMLEDMFVKEFIEPLKIEYKRQYYIKDINQFCDIYIPSKSLIIECQGTFWHCDSRFYPNGAKYQIQEARIEKDIVKKEYLENNGFKLLNIWEYDILNNKEDVKNQINEAIK